MAATITAISASARPYSIRFDIQHNAGVLEAGTLERAELLIATMLGPLRTYLSEADWETLDDDPAIVVKIQATYGTALPEVFNLFFEDDEGNIQLYYVGTSKAPVFMRCELAFVHSSNR